MIDTHCHLTDPRLAGQLDEVLAHAAAAGVKSMVTIGTEPSDWQPCLDLCRRHANLRCALGVHPNHCNQVELSHVAELRKLQSDPRVVALGEMGLDYHYDSVPRALQRQFLEAQLAIAADLDRPVIIHSRQSVDDCLAVLRNYSVRAVFHCFTGTTAEAGRILDSGYWIGFTGVVTFKKCDELRQIAAAAPADRILVETDAPYLSPEPKRGQKVNEPSLVSFTARAIAAARKITFDEIDRLTTENALAFYRWSQPHSL